MMESEPIGKCLIFNNSFKIKVTGQDGPLSERFGTELDVKSLQQTFEWLGFKIEIYEDTQKFEMIKLLSTNDHDDYGAFVCCILSHGCEEGMYTADGKIVSYEFLAKCVNGYNCKTLINKPKLFFVEACQGMNRGRVQYLGQQHLNYFDSPPTRTRSLSKPSVNPDADVLFFMSTIPGKTNLTFKVNDLLFALL